MGVGERVWNESKVTVNGKPYAIATDENDRRYIDVAGIERRHLQRHTDHYGVRQLGMTPRSTPM